jgi:hypothetical protein
MRLFVLLVLATHTVVLAVEVEGAAVALIDDGEKEKRILRFVDGLPIDERADFLNKLDIQIQAEAASTTEPKPAGPAAGASRSPATGQESSAAASVLRSTYSQVEEAKRVHLSPAPSLAAGRWIPAPPEGDLFLSASEEHTKCVHKAESQGGSDRGDCDEFDKNGPVVWKSSLAMYRPYNGTKEQLKRLMHDNKFQRFVVIGDSLTRQWSASLKCFLEVDLKAQNRVYVQALYVWKECFGRPQSCYDAVMRRTLHQGIFRPDRTTVVVNIGHHIAAHFAVFHDNITGVVDGTWIDDYRKAMTAVIKWLQKVANTEELQKSVFFRTTSPRFFHGGDWDTTPKGTCGGKAAPDENAAWSDISRTYPTQPQQNLAMLDLLQNTSFQILDTAPLMISREDGTYDCTHFCMPGPNGIWTSLLMQRLMDTWLQERQQQRQQRKLQREQRRKQRRKRRQRGG